MLSQFLGLTTPSCLPFCRALAADPTNLDVLLSLGVSHTNELDQSEAAEYLRQWLQVSILFRG